MAARLAISGDEDGSIVMIRAKGAAYKIRYERADLKAVARHTKDLPKSFINKAGNGITQGFVKYAMPLVGKLPVIETLD
jgi:6-phosphofructokinase 1